MKAMILSAGFGTRLGDITKEIPKPMLDIAGKPLLQWNIENLVKHGFNEIMINLHFLPDMIKDFVKDGSKFGAKIEYSYEEELLGTAGGVKNVESFFSKKEPFLVIYGDLLTNQNLTELLGLHIEKKADSTIIVHKRVGSNSLVRLEDDSRISGFVERPSGEERARYPFPWVNSGIQILNRSALDSLKVGEFADLPKNVYPALADSGKLYGLPLTGERVAIDSPERYEQACKLGSEMRLEDCAICRMEKEQ